MRNPSKDWSEVYFAICKGVNTTFSLKCWLAWKYRVFTQISGPNPSDYDDAHTFACDYMVYSWASKAKYNLEGRDLAEVALDGFIADEAFNAETNARLKRWMQGDGSEMPVSSERVLPLIQKKIAEILGPCEWSKVLDGCRFGNGASNTLSRARARFDKKMTTLPLTVSPDAFELALACIESDPAWGSALLDKDVCGPYSILKSEYGKLFELTAYNLFDTVPKSLKTDRTIAKEPVLNGFLQQGLHVYIRTRLRIAGVNLQDQSVNQWLAKLCQQFGLCTLDGRAASNSVVTALIQLLFPPSWFVLLDMLRSHATCMPDGTLLETEMFSSMGNAFTFELESLIFFAILSAVCGDSAVVSVYGDDMICPQENAEEVIEVLESFGFRINRDKSYVSGRFFESCGKHYFDGTDVTPIFQKEQPRGALPSRVRAANRLIRWSERMGYGIVLSPEVKNAWELLARHPEVPKGPMIRRNDDWFIMTPDFVYSQFLGISNRITGFFPRHVRHRTRQKAAYAYWLRLKAKTKAHVDAEVFRTASPKLAWALATREVFRPLKLSSFADTDRVHDDDQDNDVTYELRKVRLLCEEVNVDLKWC